VQAAPVHPVDIATRAGRLAEHGLMAASGDVGLGWDLAGVVDALGPDADRFAVGDDVVGMRDLLTAPVGAQAEQVVLDTRMCTTSGSIPTDRGWPSSPLSSTSASSPRGSLRPSRSNRWQRLTSGSRPAVSGAGSS
jgi:NADPH:quinone reductase-like Zn-dependent oxidoreductase